MYNVQSSVASLRQQTAQYMSAHRDEFMPFLVHDATGELYSEGLFLPFFILFSDTDARVLLVSFA